MTLHLTAEEIRLYREKALSPETLLSASNHIKECEACRNQVSSHLDLLALTPRLQGLPSHTTYQELEDYVDGRLSPSDQARVKGHFQECDECAREASELEALKTEIQSRGQSHPLASLTKRTRNRPLWIAAAASVTLLAGSGIWWYLKQNTPENLLAVAYTEARPFEYRLADKGYGPIRQSRAGIDKSAFDKPAALSRAEADLNQKLKDGREASDLLHLRGRAELLESQYDNAIESLTRAQEISHVDPAVLADLGCAYALRSQAEKRPIDNGHAIELLRQSIQAKPDQPIVLFNLALVYEKVGLFEEASDTWNQFLAFEKDAGWIKEARQHLAKIDDLKKRRDHARDLIRPDPAIFLSLALSDPDHLNAELYQDVAWRYWLPQINSNPTAREAFHTLAQTFQDRFHDPSLIDTFNSATSNPDITPLATLSQALEKYDAGHFDDAVPLALASAQALARNGNAAASLRARFVLVLARQRSSPAECLAAASSLVKHLRRTNYIWLQGQALLADAICRDEEGDLDLAGRDLHEAYTVLQRGPFSVLQLRTQGFLGGLFKDEGNLAGVWEVNEGGLQSCWQLGAPPIRCQQFDYDFADTSNALGWPFAAAIFQTASVREISRTELKPLEVLSKVFASVGTPDAESDLKQAEAVLGGSNSSPVNQSLLLNARLTVAEAEPPALPATKAKLKELETALAGANLDLRVRVKQALGRSLAASGDEDAAMRFFHEAIVEQQRELASIADPLTRISITETTAPTYKGLIAIQLAQKHDPSSALAAWDAYRTAWLKPQQEAQRPPAADSGRLIFISLSEGLAVLTAQGNSVSGQILKGVTQEQIQQVQQRFLRACARPDSDLASMRNDAKQLYLWLIEPLAPQITHAKTLLIDADGWLAGIPFPALLAPNGHYLVEDFAIAMSGGSTLPPANDHPLSNRDRALVVAVPSPGGHIPALHFAADEAQSVASQLPHAKFLSESAASLDALKASARDIRLFHFVGHGWSNAGDGGLIFTNGTEPTFLTATALSHLDWSHCSLVVLSACMTGTGEANGPFNPRSLVRAFLGSGAQRVVAARWNLDEAATSSLMQHFYASVLNSTAPAESLALAERAILRNPEYRHPYYWSSFAIFGEQ